MKPVNLNFASLVDNLLLQAVLLLEHEIKVISGKNVGIAYTFCHTVDENGKTSGFKELIFSPLVMREGQLGRIRISGTEPDSRFVIIQIGAFNPIPENGPGYTKKAAVFFEKKIEKPEEYFEESVLWVDLESFPSQEFCKHCVNWLFHDVHPVIKKEKKEEIIGK